MHGLITCAKLDAWRRFGHGVGRDERYTAWMRVRRNLYSPVSNLHSMSVPTYERSLQLLSGLEYESANVALWLMTPCAGDPAHAVEIREQHPAWPEEHPHPACGRHPEVDRHYGRVPGLLELAQVAGICHGVYPGTRIPFVATLDFTLCRGVLFDQRLTHWSCKPRGLLQNAPNKARMAERIALERLYCDKVGSRHVVIDGTQFPRLLATNLDWLRPLRKELRAFSESSQLRDWAAEFMRTADELSILQSTRLASHKFGLPDRIGQDFFRTAAWLGLIDIDLSLPIVQNRRLNRDARGIKRTLRLQLLGDNDGP